MILSSLQIRFKKKNKKMMTTVPLIPTPNHFWELCGLTPFLVIAISLRSWVALIVVLTGVLYHLHDTRWTKTVDVVCIVVLTLYVNLTTAWRPTLLITLGVIAAGAYNAHLHMWPIHVFFVQTPLAICLYYFEIYETYKIHSSLIL